MAGACGGGSGPSRCCWRCWPSSPRCRRRTPTCAPPPSPSTSCCNCPCGPSPGRPTRQPSRTSSGAARGAAAGQLTLPAGDGAQPAIILVLGADPAPADDERVLSLTGGLARIGFAVLLTESDDLNAAVVLPSEIPEAGWSVRGARGAPARACGTGSATLRSRRAARWRSSPPRSPRIADRVAYVVALGPYYDAESAPRPP